MYCVSCGIPIEQNDLNIPICSNCALKVLSYHLDKKQGNTISETPPDKFSELAVDFDILKELGDLNSPPKLPITEESNEIPPDDPTLKLDNLALYFMIFVLTIGVIATIVSFTKG